MRGRSRDDVVFDAPAEAVFDFLVDPRNRPVWQSSLRRVEQVDGDVRVGQTWVDVTAVGLRPAMRTTALDRPRSWTEHGRWRSIDAELTLTFATRAGGCVVQPTFALRGRGPAALVARLLTRVAPVAVRADLRRAARVLSERATGQ